MKLGEDFRIGIAKRIATDAAFADALLDETAELLSSGELDTGSSVLHLLALNTTGLAFLSEQLSLSTERLQQILSTPADGDLAHLQAILSALKDRCHQ